MVSVMTAYIADAPYICKGLHDVGPAALGTYGSKMVT